MRRTVALLALLAGALAATTASPAQASTIAYACGANICTVKPDGTQKRKLTSNGIPGTTAYAHPQLTASGKQMVFDYDNRVWVADARAKNRRAVPVTSQTVRDDTVTLKPGRRQAFYFSKTVIGYSICRFSLAGSLAPTCATVPANAGTLFEFFGWGPGDTITATYDFRHILCVLLSDFTCQQPYVAIAAPPKSFFGTPSISPNRKYVAVGVDMGPGSDQVRIAIYNAKTGKLLRYATRGHRDFPPSWAPNSKRLAFRRDHDSEGTGTRGSICTVKTTGGKVRCILKRIKDPGEPSWGG